MSLTNPNTVVTEQRLSEFYQGILPYLGGMPEMLANKFSKGDLYSTDEKMIGQWIDGKPLYSKTFTKTFQSTDTGWQTLGNIGSVDVIYYQSCLKLSNGAFMFKDDAYVGSAYNSQEMYHSSIVKVESGDLKAFVKFASGSSEYPATYTITIYYTKATDSAISIGDDTDYSTEEKIVGTWIDGKPIYQKTFTGTTSAVADNIAHNIANFDKAIYCEGYIIVSESNNTAIPVGFYNGMQYISCFTNSTQLCLRVHTDYLNKGYVITLRYTKTT